MDIKVNCEICDCNSFIPTKRDRDICWKCKHDRYDHANMRKVHWNKSAHKWELN